MSAASAPAAGTAGVGAVGLVAIGLICQQVGSSAAIMLFPEVGPLGMVMLRLVFSTLILLAIARPALRGHSPRAWRSALMLGGVLALMNSFYYLALRELPLGVTVTIEVLGPLALAVVAARTRTSWVWAGLALVGIVALGGGGWDRLTVAGVLFALGAAASWAGYILSSARVGRDFDRLDGLALAMAFGALLSLPSGIADAGGALLRIELVALGAAVAVLSSTIPYALELVALRRLTPAVFGILMSLGPALACVAGFVLLGQRLSLLEIAGVALVVVASAGAVWAGRVERAEPDLATDVPPTP
ncbi:EamA family transporter [Microbacterium esteraromaticum]|uniref:EamA family transporter n=1 Tax=Microbacterium esteraromaticum TaxID=57043 RepID=UPI001DBEF056|nr:inner membrane transporter RhtA [Microbacterium esteraromaticum]